MSEMLTREQMADWFRSEIAKEAASHNSPKNTDSQKSFHNGVIDGYVRAAWLLKIIPGDEIKAYAGERLSKPSA